MTGVNCLKEVVSGDKPPQAGAQNVLDELKAFGKESESVSCILLPNSYSIQVNISFTELPCLPNGKGYNTICEPDNNCHVLLQRDSYHASVYLCTIAIGSVRLTERDGQPLLVLVTFIQRVFGCE